jgi:hypothetical protein
MQPTRIETDFPFFQQASDFGDELHELVRTMRRLRGSAFAPRVRRAIVGRELIIELPLGIGG